MMGAEDLPTMDEAMDEADIVEETQRKINEVRPSAAPPALALSHALSRTAASTNYFCQAGSPSRRHGSPICVDALISSNTRRLALAPHTAPELNRLAAVQRHFTASQPHFTANNRPQMTGSWGLSAFADLGAYASEVWAIHWIAISISLMVVRPEPQSSPPPPDSPAPKPCPFSLCLSSTFAVLPLPLPLASAVALLC